MNRFLGLKVGGFWGRMEDKKKRNYSMTKNDNCPYVSWKLQRKK
jgi:hypothetical protein